MIIIEKVLDLIFPPTCEICGKVGTYICNGCYQKIKKYEITDKDNSKKVISAYQYKDIIRELLIDYKFNDKSYLSKLFAEIIIKNENVCTTLKSCDIIIPVPLHRKRKLERGYNQSQLIVDELAKIMELNVQNKVLKKVKNIRPQSKKSYEQRMKDIKGVYIVENSNQILNKKIVLFDDVYTTGSTTRECKKVLMQAGTKSVEIMTLTKDLFER